MIDAPPLPDYEAFVNESTYWLGLSGAINVRNGIVADK